jgi:hypothetical protein
MGARRYGLRDDQLERIEELLPGRRVRSAVRLKTTGYLWRRYCIDIGPGFHGATCRNALVIFALCIPGSAVGPDGACGRSCSSIWSAMRITQYP